MAFCSDYSCSSRQLASADGLSQARPLSLMTTFAYRLVIHDAVLHCPYFCFHSPEELSLPLYTHSESTSEIQLVVFVHPIQHLSTMSTVTTTTVTPAAGQTYTAQPAYAPAVAQAPLPAVASSYTTGASLPQYGSLPAAVPAGPVTVAAPVSHASFHRQMTR